MRVVRSTYSDAERLERAGAPKRAARFVLNRRETEALGYVARFLASDDCVLVLAGPKGVGKTVAACTAVLSVGWASARFIRASELARVGLYDAAAHERLRSPALLVVDDLGVEYTDSKGYFCSLIDSLIDVRYGDMTRTIVTTNMRASDFLATYGERVADRIREAGEFVELAGESMRGPEVVVPHEESDGEALAGPVPEPVPAEKVSELVAQLVKRYGDGDDVTREDVRKFLEAE